MTARPFSVHICWLKALLIANPEAEWCGKDKGEGVGDNDGEGQ